MFGFACRLVAERELLAPAVAHWQHVQQLEEQVAATELHLLKDQQEHGSKLMALQQQQVGHELVRNALSWALS